MTPAAPPRATLAPAPAAIGACLLAAALAGGDHAFADGKLYRWTEGDGSVTFSPAPPIDGTPFTVIDPATLSPLSGSDDSDPSERAALSVERDTGQALGAAAPARTRAPEVFTSIAGPGPGMADRPPRFVADDDERCTELSKRVVSLERRLTAPLTPMEMDDTVVRMARYQHRFESLCR